MKKYLLLLLAAGIQLLAYGQDSDYSICDCCTQSLFQYKNDFEQTLSSAIIKARGIKVLTIYTTSRQNKGITDTAFTVVDPEYKELIFRFNQDGYVISEVSYNRRGHYHSIYTYTRDKDNKILSRTFDYLDEAGNKIMDNLSEKHIYTYTANRLVKIKKLGDQFREQADDKSEYISFAYDTKGRITSEINYSYYDWADPSYAQKKTKYNDANRTSLAAISDKKGQYATIKTSYNSLGQILKQQYYSGKAEKPEQEQLFRYNAEGQLIAYQVKSPGVGSECPDNGNFTDTLLYNSQKLISQISHRYQSTSCTLRFVYQ